MADIFKKLRGIIGNVLQFGKEGGHVKYNNTDNVFEVWNEDESALIKFRALSPVGDNDVVTKKYADTLAKPVIVSRQADCSLSLPTNTATRGFVVVTTAGSGAAVGDLLYDDGSGSGSMEILTAVDGRTIAVTVALTGGTVSFEADSLYIWDGDNTQWVKIGDIGSVTGAVREIRIIIGTSSVDSVFEIPANNRVNYVSLEIGTAYNVAATIEIGNSTTDDLLMLATENNPKKAGSKWVKDAEDIAFGGSADQVSVTITGATAGDGVVVVRFSNPVG